MKKFGVKLVGSALAVWLGSSLLTACGEDSPTDDNGGNGGEDTSSGGSDSGGSGSGGSGATGGSGGGAGGEDPIGPDVPESALIQPKTAVVVTNMLNAFASVYASDGKLYVAGVTDTGALGAAQSNGNLYLAVWRFNADGSADATFGTAGVATSTVVNPGTAYDIVEWQDGSFAILISGGDHAVAIVPFSGGTFGAVSTQIFGWDNPAALTAALSTKNAAIDAVCGPAKTACDAASTTLSSGVCFVGGVNYDADDCAEQTAACADATEDCQDEYAFAVAPNFNQRPANYSSWGMALDDSGSEPKLVVFAAGPAADAETSDRWDADRWITRVNADDLSFDTSFNEGQPFGLDISGLNLPDNARRGTVDVDGTIVSAGYTNIPGGKGNHITLIRLLPSGKVDEDFGFSDDDDVDFTPGQTHYNPFRGAGGFAEAYGAAILSDGSYVTTGYGTSNMFVPSVHVDLVVSRLNATGTALVPTFGGKPGSVVSFPGAYAVQSEADTAAVYVSAEERGRDVVALSDDRTIHAGLYDGQASLVVLTPDGQPDTDVLGTGRLIYRWTTNFFSANTDAERARVVATSDEVAKVVGTSYARTLIVTVDVVEPAD